MIIPERDWLILRGRLRAIAPFAIGTWPIVKMKL
jgi:hypothetical protein